MSPLEIADSLGLVIGLTTYWRSDTNILDFRVPARPLPPHPQHTAACRPRSHAAVHRRDVEASERIASFDGNAEREPSNTNT